MKYHLLLLLILPSILSAQPSKGIDSAALKNDSLFTYSRGVKSFRGEASVKFNYNRSLGLGYNMNLTGIGSFGFGPNVVLAGHNSIAVGQNPQNYANGATNFGADNINYSTANYSFVANDGNEAFSVSSLTGGFGNNNYDENGVLFGNSNTLGTTPNQYRSSFLGGERNVKLSGDGTFGFGRVLRQSGNYNTTFGTGKRGTLIPLISDEPESFNVGYGSGFITFTIHAAPEGKSYGVTEIRGPVKINGVYYEFPSVQGAPGSVLTNDGTGKLEWVVPAQPKPIASQNILLNPKAIAVYNNVGQLLYIKQLY